MDAQLIEQMVLRDVNESKPLPTTTPEEVGIPSEAVARFIERINAKRLCMHSVLMLRGGKLAFEAYWKPYDRYSLQRMYSTSKSVVAVAVGRLITEGLVKIDDPIIKYFPEETPGDVDPYLAQATIRHLLMMSTPFPGTTYRNTDKDWGATFLEAKGERLPGRIFRYDTSATTMLCILVRKVTGVEFMEYLRGPLFDKLGISGNAWCIETPCGHEWGGSGVLFTSRDLAKFALFCMNKGLVNGERVVDEQFMSEATGNMIDSSLSNTSPESKFGYGYQFWRTRHNGFSCRGMGGQTAVCLPDHDFALITTADTQSDMTYHAFFEALWEEILPHLKKQRALPADPPAFRTLEAVADTFTLQPAYGSAESPTAAKVNNRTYELAGNDMGIRNVRFEFKGDNGVLHYENATGVHSLGFGFGFQHEQEFPETHYYGKRIGTPYGKGYSCHISAGWIMEDSLEVVCYATDAYLGTLRMNFVFRDDNVTIMMLKNAEWFFEEYHGSAVGECAE